MTQRQMGLIAGLTSYAMWGFFPIYWKMLSHRAPFEILSHRVLWSFVFYALLFVITQKNSLRELKRLTKKDWLLSSTAALLLTVNWGLYIYAVNSGHILEGSLAYFINPLLNVAVGVLFFQESFSRPLKIAVSLAAIGVAVKVLYADQFPWIALVLAFTFCSYGVTKKVLSISPQISSVMESFVVIPLAMIILVFYNSASSDVDPRTLALFIGSGVVTGLPLFLFSFAAQRVPYSLLGLFQFIAPTLQFISAIYLFGEKLKPQELGAFGLIWIGLVFYAFNQLRHSPNHGK